MVEKKEEDRDREIEQVKGAATPRSGPGLGGAAPTGKQEKQELQSEITGNEKLREVKRVRVDLTAPQLSETKIMLKPSKLSRKSENRSRLVQGSCVTCTEVGEGDCSAKRRSCVDGIHPHHRTAKENISRRVSQVVEICPQAKNPLPLMKAMVDTMPDGVRMIGANKQALTEYIKMRVVGEDRMALQVRPNYGTSSEGVYGQGSAALLSETPHISNHSRALGGAAKLRRAAHAEVPSAKQDLVNKPIKKTKTPPCLGNSEKVRSGGAGEKVPEKQILERSEPVKNNPNLGPNNVKKLEPEK